jgi:hypothetical protein
VNFVTHLNSRRRPLFTLPDAELTDAYLRDFRAVFGHDLDPFWVNVARVPMYSAVFTPGFRNPPSRSATWPTSISPATIAPFPRSSRPVPRCALAAISVRRSLAISGLSTELPAAAAAFSPARHAPRLTQPLLSSGIISTANLEFYE